MCWQLKWIVKGTRGRWLILSNLLDLEYSTLHDLRGWLHKQLLVKRLASLGI